MSKVFTVTDEYFGDMRVRKYVGVVVSSDCEGLTGSLVELPHLFPRKVYFLLVCPFFITFIGHGNNMMKRSVVSPLLWVLLNARQSQSCFFAVGIIHCPKVFKSPPCGNNLHTRAKVQTSALFQPVHLPYRPYAQVLSFEEMRDGPFGLPATYPADATDVPLLLYLGFEAVRDNNAEVLGKLGSRIIAETVYGIVEFSTPSVLLEQVNATTFVSRISGTSTLTFLDLLDYIGWH